MPKLSVIVPVYNVEQYLEKCVESILSQTFNDFELILVDDGSKDSCPAICDAFAEKDSRTRVIHQKNGGRSVARNIGIENAKGDILTFVDGDDYISPEMYENMINLLIEHNADIVACGINYVDNIGNKISEWPSLDENKIYGREDFINNYHHNVRRHIMPSVCNKIFKKSLFDFIRFPCGKEYEDAAIQLSVFDNCNTIVVDKNHYYQYLSRESGITNAPFSDKNLDHIDLSYNNYLFFKNKEINKQAMISLSVYLDDFLDIVFKILFCFPQYKDKLQPYINIYNDNFYNLLKCNKICKIKKIILFIFRFNKSLAYIFYKRYFL